MTKFAMLQDDPDINDLLSISVYVIKPVHIHNCWIGDVDTKAMQGFLFQR